MPECISRKSFFDHHPLAAQYIAQEQQARLDTIMEYPPRQKYILKYKKQHDCLHYLHSDAAQFNQFGVLAYPAQNTKDYRMHLPSHLLHFFQQLDQQEFYFFDYRPQNWLNFPFESFSTRNRFRKMIGKRKFYGCIKTDAEGFGQLFPLFLFSRRFNDTVMFLYSSGKHSLLMFLCDDGNLHMSYNATDASLIAQAAASAGLVMGGVQICSRYYTSLLK